MQLRNYNGGEQQMQGAMCTVIPFSNREPLGDRLLTRDKIDLCLWESACDHPGVARVVVHEGGSELREPDLVLIYAPGTVWARWGVARQGDRIVVWECAFGKDLGRYPTMREALSALEDHADGITPTTREQSRDPLPLRPQIRRGA
jgi:hypothetical protein